MAGILPPMPGRGPTTGQQAALAYTWHRENAATPEEARANFAAAHPYLDEKQIDRAIQRSNSAEDRGDLVNAAIKEGLHFALPGGGILRVVSADKYGNEQNINVPYAAGEDAQTVWARAVQRVNLVIWARYEETSWLGGKSVTTVVSGVYQTYGGR